MSTVCAAATQHDDLGGLLILLIGVTFYAGVVIKDYLADVRYYRARRIVRDRQAVR